MVMENQPRFESLSGLSGTLLVAHPTLEDPNFARTVILLPVHSGDNGGLGVILNRPTGSTLGEMFPDQAFEKLAHIRVFEGGPVDAGQLILTAWKWDAEENSHKMFFGISSENALELLESEDPVTVRAYLGYAGWSAGQLEAELEANAWITQPIRSEVLEEESGPQLWDQLTEEGPSLGGDFDGNLPLPPDDLDWN